MLCPLSWNPINLIDGESHWIIWEMAYIIIALFVSKFLSLALDRLATRINAPSFGLFADAVYRPAIYLIWFLVALHSIDLVTDEFLSQGKPKAWITLVNGGVVLALGWFLLRLKDNVIAHTIEMRTSEGKIAEAHSMQGISKLFTAVIGIITLVLLNDFTGMNFTTLLAVGGVGGLALAFASQEIVSNFFGGFMIHMTRPFLIGEEVSLPSMNISGIVEEIGWYQTRIRPRSKEAVYVPNSLFSKALLINKTRITHRLFDESLYIEIEPLSKLTRVLQDIDTFIASHPQFDLTEWTGSRIESVGPISLIIVNGHTRTTSAQEFYRLRGEVLLQIAAIVTACGGTVVRPPPTVIHS